jgi:2-polyprenyl-6-methoxyphenol hydroxylase-like FAD-dependent oxidoreductase
MNSDLPSTTDVLIVGAGPTGLAAALSLLHHSPPSRRITIIDALPKGQNDSRALVIHSRTMEVPLPAPNM